MRRILLFIATIALTLNSCGIAVTEQSQQMIVMSPTKPKSSPTAIPKPPTPTIVYDTKIPTLTLTPNLVIDSKGNITWHPKEVLIAYEVGGGDGVGFDYPPEFVLLWDGTLLQPGSTQFGQPYISHLDQTEICKILKTIDSSGFFEEPRFYNFPFDGFGSQYITVNAWKSNSSGSQIFTYALSGAPYYDGLFCRNCPVPSEQTIIQPGLANVYFLLKNYVSEDREIAPVEKLKVYFWPVDEEPTDNWPINSIAPSEIAKKCDESNCYDVGMILDGVVAEEFMDKVRGDQVFTNVSIMNSQPFRVLYRAVWPYEPSVMYSSVSEGQLSNNLPTEFKLTCAPENDLYPLLPLNKDNKFWYYAPDGKWGAEVINEQGQSPKVRIVNRFGYEKYYQYNPVMFTQTSLKVFPRFWTQDRRYFFVNILPGDFDIQGTPFTNSIGLQRISIDDGKVSYMFSGVAGQEYAYTMSEDGKKIVYVRQGDQPLKITFKDTYSEDEKTVTLALPNNGTGTYVSAGSITWSVDEQTAYLAAVYSENGVESGRVLAINTSNPVNQTIIYVDSTPFKLVQFSFHDWDAGICKLDADIESYCPKRLHLDVGTIGN